MKKILDFNLNTIKIRSDKNGTKFSIFHQKNDKRFLEHLLILFDISYKESRNILLINDELGLNKLKNDIQIFIKNPKSSKLEGIRYLFNIDKKSFINFLSQFILEIDTFLKNRSSITLGFRITTLFKNHKDETFQFTELYETLKESIETELYSALQRFVKKKQLIEIKSPLENIPFKFSAYKLTANEKLRIEQLESQRIRKADERKKQFRGTMKKAVFETIEVLEWPTIDEIILYLTQIAPEDVIKYSRNYIKITLTKLYNVNGVIKKGIPQDGETRYAKSSEPKEVNIEPDFTIYTKDENLFIITPYFTEEIPLEEFIYEKSERLYETSRILILNIKPDRNIYAIYYKEYNQLGAIIELFEKDINFTLKTSQYLIRFPVKEEFIVLLSYLREKYNLGEINFFSIKARELKEVEDF